MLFIAVEYIARNRLDMPSLSAKVANYEGEMNHVGSYFGCYFMMNQVKVLFFCPLDQPL